MSRAERSVSQTCIPPACRKLSFGMKLGAKPMRMSWRRRIRTVGDVCNADVLPAIDTKCHHFVLGIVGDGEVVETSIGHALAAGDPWRRVVHHLAIDDGPNLTPMR